MLVPGQTLMSQVRGRGHLYPAQRMLLFLAQESDFSLLPTAVSCDAVLLSALFPGSMPAPHLALHSMRAPVFSDLFSLHPSWFQEMVPSTWQSLNYIWRLKGKKWNPVCSCGQGDGSICVNTGRRPGAVCSHGAPGDTVYTPHQLGLHRGGLDGP